MLEHFNTSFTVGFTVGALFSAVCAGIVVFVMLARYGGMFIEAETGVQRAIKQLTLGMPDRAVETLESVLGVLAPEDNQ